MAMTVQEKRDTFRALHRRGCFILPNPWDVGSALLLQKMGFSALATTSSGYAWSLGLPDGKVPRAQVLEHLRTMVQATNLPINADFESGFGADPSDVSVSVQMAIDTGVAGLSIEDSTGNPLNPLRGIPDAVARLRAARNAIDGARGDTLLIGRAENFIVGRPDLDDVITRLKAYADAGADCLYAPGIQSREQIEAVVSAVAPKPVNLLIGAPSKFSLKEIEEMGVRRISVGGALARCAWAGLLRSASMLAHEGKFAGFTGAATYAEVNGLFT